MNVKLRKWLPISLCCLPGVTAVTVVGVALVVGEASFGEWFGVPLGLGLIGLALLTCPLSMGFMMWRGRNAARGRSSIMAGCYLPDEALASLEAEPSANPLVALRERREALERELAEL